MARFRRLRRRHGGGIDRQTVGLILTSGKVPLEKTLDKSVMIQHVDDGVDEF